MKVKLLKSNWDPQTGRSQVTISTKYGQFSAYAQVADEDKEYASRFLGCEIAEKKAIIKALKARLQILKVRHSEAWYIFDTFDQSNSLHPPKCLWARLKELEDKIAHTQNVIVSIENTVDKSVAAYIQKAKQRGQNK